jgi:hypothetical protein
VQKLGKNHGRYHGETIGIASVLNDFQQRALERGWTHETIPVSSGLELQSWHRNPPRPRRRVYVSAGIHGDEPAGPLAACQLIAEDLWPAGIEVVIFPCLNPAGFPLNRRENAQGFDLNRQYLQPEAPEVRAHIDWLAGRPGYDLTLCLHEDWESHGFYVYELNPEHRASHAEEMIRRVAEVCPIDLSAEIEGRPARGGIIRPDIDPSSRPQWPEAFWLLNHKTRHSYTLEAPSDFPMATRVAALVTAVRAVLETI